MSKGNIRLEIEKMIENEYKEDRMQYSTKEKCYHPFYDGKNGYRAQAMEDVLNFIIQRGVIS